MTEMVDVKCATCGAIALRATQRVLDEAKRRKLRPACEACAGDTHNEAFLDEFEHEMECGD